MDIAKKDQKHTLIAGIAAVLLFIVGLIFYQASQEALTSATTPFEPSEVNSLSAKKQQIVAMVSTKERLTPSEKRQILRDVAGAQFARYEFSDEEKMKLLQALNKK